MRFAAQHIDRSAALHTRQQMQMHPHKYITHADAGSASALEVVGHADEDECCEVVRQHDPEVLAPCLPEHQHADAAQVERHLPAVRPRQLLPASGSVRHSMDSQIVRRSEGVKERHSCCTVTVQQAPAAQQSS